MKDPGTFVMVSVVLSPPEPGAASPDIFEYIFAGVIKSFRLLATTEALLSQFVAVFDAALRTVASGPTYLLSSNSLLTFSLSI